MVHLPTLSKLGESTTVRENWYLDTQNPNNLLHHPKLSVKVHVDTQKIFCTSRRLGGRYRRERNLS